MNMVESLLIALTDSQNERGKLAAQIEALQNRVKELERAASEHPGD